MEGKACRTSLPATVLALAVVLVIGACGAEGAATRERPAAPAATEILATAIDLMGGAEALQAIERVRYDVITQWSRPTYGGEPFADRPSYELHTDVRDYRIPAWRNTRRFGARGREVVDLVTEDVAVRDFGAGFQPLNIAYVDEKRELFAYTPDRLVLGLRDAPDLESLADSAVAGVRYARVRGTVDGFPMTLHLRRSDALPSMVSFRAAHPNDFGLVPWGTMSIAVWYSGWQTLEGGVSLPMQWAIERIGHLYKRLTITDMTLNPSFEADSFAVTPDLAEAYRATATRPMHDLPLDSARVDGDFVTFGVFGSPAGAVRVGEGWVLLETGQARLSLDRARGWLDRNAPGPLVGAVVTTTRGNGGAPALVESGVPVLTGPSLAPHLSVVLRNHGVGTGDVDSVEDERWIGTGSDSVLVTRLDLPDHPGGILVYSPRLRWLYAYEALRPLDVALLRERARREGWTAEWIGNARGLRQRMDAAGG